MKYVYVLMLGVITSSPSPTFRTSTFTKGTTFSLEATSDPLTRKPGMKAGSLLIHLGVPQVEADSRELFMESPSALGDLEERLGF